MWISSARYPASKRNDERASRAAEAGAYTFEIISDGSRLAALRTAWNSLYGRAERPYVAQSFDWVACSWDTVARPRGERLHCLVMRHQGEVVLIWPLFVRRRWGFWRDAYGAAAGATEYTELLLDRRFREGDLLATAWRLLHSSCPAHLIRLRRVRAGSDLARFLADQPVMVTSVNEAPYTSFAGYATWDDYLNDRTGNLRRGTNRQRRRLAERGSVTVDLITENPLFDAAVEELFRWKRRQFHDRGEDLIAASPENEAFWKQVHTLPGLVGKVVIFALKVNDRIVAAELSCVDDSRVELFVRAYDPSWARYAPGKLLNAHCLRWAFDRGLGYDFRIGTEPYKYLWADRVCVAVNYEIVSAPWGRIFVKLRKVVRIVQDHIGIVGAFKALAKTLECWRVLNPLTRSSD